MDKRYNVLIYVYSPKRLSEYISFCQVIHKNFNLFFLTDFEISKEFTNTLELLNIEHINLQDIYKEQHKPFIYRMIQKYFYFFSKIKRTNLGQQLFEFSYEKIYLYYSKLMASIILRNNIDLYITTFDNTYAINELGFIYELKKQKIPILLAYVINYHPDANYAVIKNNPNYLINEKSSIYEKRIFKKYHYLTYKNVHFYQAYIYKILEKYNMIPEISWMQGGGFSDKISVPNKYTYERYKEFGISEKKLIILPDLSMAELYKSFQNKENIKLQIIQKYQLKQTKIMLVGLANWYEHSFTDLQTHKEIINYTLQATLPFHDEYSVVVTLHPSMEKKNYLYIEEKYNVKILDEKLYTILPIVDFYLADQSSTVIWSVILEIKTLIIAIFKDFHMYEYLQSVKTVTDEKELYKELQYTINSNIDFKNDICLLSKKEIFNDHLDALYIKALLNMVNSK